MSTSLCRSLLRLMVLAVSLLAAGACSQATPAVKGEVPLVVQAGGSDLQATAAAEATAMIQSARATAVVLQAQAEATALVEWAKQPAEATIAPAVDTVTDADAATPAAGAVASASQLRPTRTPAPNTLNLMLVTLGAEGSLISVQYTGSPQAAGRLTQGNVYVIDEANGTRYDAVPVMPIVGPLLQRPVHAGQICNVMFTNMPPMLKQGAVVTVVLGDYKWEHVPVQ